MTRWAGYLRVSTAEQAESGLGLEAQRRELSRALGDDVTWFVDEGVSATVPFERRPGALAMFDALAAGDVDGIAVHKLDRAARSSIHAAQLFAWCRTHRIAFKALDLGVDLTTPSGRMVATIMSAVAEFELELIGARQRDAHASKRARGDRRGVAADPALLERITASRAAGMTWQAIADDLNADGVPTVGRARRNAAGDVVLEHGTAWRVSSVQSAGGYRRPGKTGDRARSTEAVLPAMPRRVRRARTTATDEAAA